MRAKMLTRIFAAVFAACVAFASVPEGQAFAAGTEAASGTELTGLTTEYLSNPIGIDTDSIRFGWKMKSDAVGAKQTAYQVQVFAGDGTVAWDSGRVESSRSVGIVCGESLKERSIYRWEVTVWDETGASVKSGASFETGVTNWQEWKDTEFIRMNKSRLAPVFRTEQPLAQAKRIEKARLYITALGAYQAYVNGEQAGEWDEDGKLIYHHMNPGYGNANVSLGYQTYDVTPFLETADTAAVSVMAGTGWYNGMGNTGTSQPAVKALLAIDYEDGTQQLIKTNTSDWKGTLAGGVTANGVYYGEDYNACFARELGDYTQTGYDDSGWVNADGGGETESAVPCIETSFDEQTAAYVRVLVNQTGPAISGANENFLQLMELELLDADGKNVVSGIVPEISNTWSPNSQWAPEHLTDGDLGADSDKGYTTTLFGTAGAASYTPDEPVSISFFLGSGSSFDTLKMYPRTSTASVSGKECANYPKNFILQVSDDGAAWVDVDLDDKTDDVSRTVSGLRNTVLFPEVEAVNFGTDFGEEITAKHVKLSVQEVGPAVYEEQDKDKENRLQLMELELLNGQENKASGVVPVISNNFEAGTQWRAANLTDGDYGIDSDSGYTSEVLGYQEQFVKLDTSIDIQFDFDEEITFSELKMYPRISKDSISYGVCANYPKAYTVWVSRNGTEWTKAAEEDAGLVRQSGLLQNMEMSTTEFSGEIRAQVGIPGRMTGAYDQQPVSAVLYSGTKADSEYEGGEILVDASYEGADLFGSGIGLKKGQTMIVNMGQNLTAVPNIRFEAAKGTRANLRFAEMLNDGSSVGSGAFQADGPKGSIYQKSLRNARSRATYVFAGDGVETYQPSMSFFGYQYVELTASDDIVVYGLVSKGISSVSEQTGSITTNNENVNKLFQNVLYGQLSNYYTAPTDCNQRDERLSWTGDTQAFAQTAVYNFDSYAFLNDMQDIFAEVTEKYGYVPSVTDQSGSFFGNWAAGWSDVLIIVPWTLYMQTGDVSVLEENWNVMDQYMKYLQARERGSNQCWIPDNSRNYGDWLSFQGTSIEVIYDYYYGYMHQMMAKIARILGKTSEQEAYESKFEGIKEAFLATHVTFEDGKLVIKSGEGNKNYQFMYSAGKGGVWENNSQTALLWMLKLGFYNSGEMKEAATQLLLENIKNENPDASSIRAQYGENTLAVGFLGSNVITPVLTESGNAEVSYDLLLQDGQPSWLFEVKAGATTVWERWNSYTPGAGFGDSEMNSFNHYAYGSVVEWMYRYMAGISADEENPGFQHIVLQPVPDTGTQYNGEERIHSAEASYESCYGTITSGWSSEDGKLTAYHTRVPANTTATLFLPVGSEEAMERFPELKGVSYQGMTEHNGQMTAEILLEAGSFEFTVTDGKVSAAYGSGSGEAPNPENPNPGQSGSGTPNPGQSGTETSNPGTAGTESGRISLSSCTVLPIAEQYFDGGAKQPEVAVSYQGTALQRGRDYTVAYENNVNIGEAKAVVTGMGAYAGTAEAAFQITVKKNAVYAIGNYKYRITKAESGGKGTVTLSGVKSSLIKKKLKKISVPAAVKLGGQKFQVTAVGKNAFKSCTKVSSAVIGSSVATIESKAFYNCKKLKKITIKSKKLKKTGKNAFGKINAKAVLRVPKSKLKAYQRLLKKSGLSKSIKVSAGK